MLFEMRFALPILFLTIISPTAFAMPAGFVSLSAVTPDVIVEMRYATAHNFIGKPIDGYLTPKCILTEETANALAAIETQFLAFGLTLKVYDCYRPQRAVDSFVKWAQDLSDRKMKAEFYPRVDKENLFRDGYIAARSGHSRGSTVDLTLVELPASAQGKWNPGEELHSCFGEFASRFPDNSIDMGTGFDCFDTLAHPANPLTGSLQKRNRLLLKSVMERGGFYGIDEEWWHFTLNNEPYPQTWFDFEIND